MSMFKIDIGIPVMFVHVPKTGGTSIRKSRQISECRLVDMDPKWSDLPSFGFVRDPFDRAVSAWKDFRYSRKMTNLGFRDFVIWYNRKDIDNLINIPSTIEHHMAPMGHTVHGLRYAKFIGQYENLQNDFDKFVASLGCEVITLAHERKAKKISNTPSKTENLELIKKYYARDYELTKGLGFEY